MKSVQFFFLITIFFLFSTNLFAQIQISDFEYSQKDSIKVDFEMITSEGNNNIIFASKPKFNETSSWQDNQIPLRLFLNKIDDKHEILPNLNIKVVTDLKTNEDGSLSILIASDNRLIYSINTIDFDNYLIEDSIALKNVKCNFCSLNMPKFFQNDILYFSDGKLFKRSNKITNFVIDATNGGYEWYISDKFSYAYITKYGSVIFNGNLYNGGEHTNTNPYIINKGKLYFNSSDLYEIEKVDSNFKKVKIEKKGFGVLIKSNNTSEFYSTKTKGDTTTKYLWANLNRKFEIVDSVNLIKTQKFQESDFEGNFIFRKMFQTGLLSGEFRNLLQIKSKNYIPFTISWGYSNEYAQVKILKMKDEKVIFLLEEFNSEETLIFVNLRDSTKTQFFSSKAINNSENLFQIVNSSIKKINLIDCEVWEESIPQIQTKTTTTQQYFTLKLAPNSTTVYGISPQNIEKYIKFENSSIIVKFDSSIENQHLISTNDINVFYSDENINKVLSYKKDKELIITDNFSKSVFKIALPFDLKKGYKYSILFPNNNIVLINSENGMYFYNFSKSNLIFLGENSTFLIDKITNDIIVYKQISENPFTYYYFGQTTINANKYSFNLNESVSLRDIYDSIIRFWNGNEDYLFNINKDGSLSRINKFWKDNIYAFCKNKNEILVFTFDNSYTNYTVYSNITPPFKTPNELRNYGFPGFRFTNNNEILFSYFTNDFNKIAKFKFDDRKFYYLDEDILSSSPSFSDDPILKNVIKKNGKLYFLYLKKGDKLQFESKILYESDFYNNHDYLNFGLYKGAYVLASEKSKDPQIYKLKESNINFKWIPFDTENLSIDEAKVFDAILYPNPNSGMFTISSDNEIDKILIFNLIGQKIFETIEVQNLNYHFLPKGLYILQIYSGNKYISKRLIIQ